jgi:hypothetical protein
MDAVARLSSCGWINWTHRMASKPINALVAVLWELKTLLMLKLCQIVKLVDASSVVIGSLGNCLAILVH